MFLVLRFLEGLEVALRHLLEGEVCQDVLARSRAECRPAFLVVEKFQNWCGEGTRISRLDEDAACVVFDGIFQSIQIAGNDDAFAGGRFDGVYAEALHGSGRANVGRNDDVSGAEERLHVAPGEICEKVNARFEVGFACGAPACEVGIFVSGFGANAAARGDEYDIVRKHWQDVSYEPFDAFVLDKPPYAQDDEGALEVSSEEFLEILARAIGDDIFRIDGIGDEDALALRNAGACGLDDGLVAYGNEEIEVSERRNVDEAIDRSQEGLFLGERDIKSVDDRGVNFARSEERKRKRNGRKHAVAHEDGVVFSEKKQCFCEDIGEEEGKEFLTARIGNRGHVRNRGE